MNMSTKKKSKGRKGCLLLILLFIGPLLWLNFTLTNAEKENKFRVLRATVLKNKVEQYYSEHNRYPVDTALLVLVDDPMIVDFLNKGVLSYSTDPSGKEWFAITCRYAVFFSSGEGSYSRSWSGVQYSNNVKKLPVWAGENPTPDPNGFYSADFH